MLYYSEITKETYRTVRDLRAAEAKYSQKMTDKEELEAKLKEALKNVDTCRKNWENAYKEQEVYVKTYKDKWEDAVTARNKILTEYCKKYGSYKISSDAFKDFPEFENLWRMFF